MGLNWLITGGCGFIGTSLIKFLNAEGGHSIRVIDNLSVGTREDLTIVTDFHELELSDGGDCASFSPSECQLVVGDIMDEGLALNIAKGADVIVHLAANTGVGPSVENPRLDCTTNVMGTFNYIEAARKNKVGRFIFASSGAPAGEVEPPIHEEIAPHPVSPYGASKLAGEGYCSAYKRSFDLDTVALRFGNVYGPGSVHKGSVVAKFIKQAMSGDRLEIYGDGSQTRDFIFIDDLVRAIRLAADAKGVGGEIFQIATSSETTVNELLEALKLVMSNAGFSEPEVMYTEPRVGDVMRNYSDTRKAKGRLGWQAEVSLKDGLSATVDWFKNRQ